MLTFIRNDRVLEWTTSLILFLFGTSLLMPGDTLSLPSYQPFQQMGLSDISLAVILIAVGLSRMVALYINGSWRQTPKIRMVGAVLGATIFVAIGGSFIVPALLYKAIPTTAATTYLVLCVADIYSANRAGQDAGLIHH
jgi:ABC-type glycerol-3-phosphate transport system permease component